MLLLSSVSGAGDEARTRYLHLGKVALYQMSYTRRELSLNYTMQFREIWCLRSESNQRHGDFQSPALPTELQRQMATRKGLEPSTSGVTGVKTHGGNNRARTCDIMLVRHALSQLSYAPLLTVLLIARSRRMLLY